MRWTVDELPRVDLNFDTPDHIDWPECTEYPGTTGTHHDHELAQDEPGAFR